MPKSWYSAVVGKGPHKSLRHRYRTGGSVSPPMPRRSTAAAPTSLPDVLAISPSTTRCAASTLWGRVCKQRHPVLIQLFHRGNQLVTGGRIEVGCGLIGENQGGSDGGPGHGHAAAPPPSVWTTAFHAFQTHRRYISTARARRSAGFALGVEERTCVFGRGEHRNQL